MIKPCCICGKPYLVKRNIPTCENPECKRERHRRMRMAHYVKKEYEPIYCRNCGVQFKPKRYDQLYCDKKPCQQARKNLYDQDRDRTEFQECATYKEELKAMREKVMAETLAKYEKGIRAIKKARLDVECYADNADRAIAKFSKLSSPCEAVDLQRAC